MPESGDLAVLVEPEQARPRGLVLYLHGRSGDELSLFEDDRIALLDALLGAGYLVAGPNMHGDQWGNRLAQSDIAALVRWVRRRHDVPTLFVIGESMGANAAEKLLRLGEIEVAATVLLAPSLSLPSVWKRGEEGRRSLTAAYGLALDGSDVLHRTAEWDAARHVPANYPPIRVYASRADRIAAVDTVTAPWVEGLRRAGTDVDLIEVTGDHVSDDHIRPADVVAYFGRFLS